jgi:hypothetical protein
MSYARRQPSYDVLFYNEVVGWLERDPKDIGLFQVAERLYGPMDETAQTYEGRLPFQPIQL